MMSPIPKSINVKGKLIDFSSPKVMGVINITPDSFYEGSRFMREEEYLNAAVKMVEEGADIIDIGGYSTRPGASEVSPEEERDRVLKAIKLINRELPDLIISIDTFRADIAMEAVLECGAGIINDITGGEADKKMFGVVEKLNVPYVLMHMKGTPGKMEKNPVYDDVVADILRWLGGRITRLQSQGVNDIIIDPGFGFGKTVNHNFEMLRRLRDFSITGLPVLVGISRKSMIWKSLEIRPEEARNGTAVLNTAALLNGADILRVHDVREAVQAVRLVGMLRKDS
jgi:dihydropteroate synthase